MANNLSAFTPELWASLYQNIFNKVPVYTKIASFKHEAKLEFGDQIHVPVEGLTPDQDMDSDGTFTPADYSVTDDTVLVDQWIVAPTFINDKEKKQSQYDLMRTVGKQQAITMANRMDARVLSEATNATYVIDASDFAGAVGEGITPTTTNVKQILLKVRTKIARNNALMATGELFGAVDPYYVELLIEGMGDRDTVLGDKTFLTRTFTTAGGFKIHETNACAWSGVLGVATTITANDTIVAGGVTFTGKASPAVAGEFKVGVSADADRAALTLAINAHNTGKVAVAAPAGEYIPFATAQTALRDVVATNDDTANTMTVVAKGQPLFTVSETLTAGADVWSKEVTNMMCGVKGYVQVVRQMTPGIEFARTTGANKAGTNIISQVLFGHKLLSEEEKAIVNVKIALPA